MKTVVIDGNHQVRYFTFGYFFKEFAAGFTIISERLQELARIYIDKGKMKLRERLLRFRGRLPTRDLEQQPSEAKRDETDLQHVDNLLTSSSSSSLVQLVDKQSGGRLRDHVQMVGDDYDHPTTLHFGFVLLSRMLNTCIQFIPAFTLNLRFGLSPSRTFIVLSYLLLIFILFSSIHLSSFMLEPSIQMFVGRMNDTLKRICTVSTAIGQVGYISYSLASCAYILHQRKFLQNFIYNSCSIITLSRYYQRHQMVSLFIAFNLFAFLAEPLFGVLALLHDVRQPAYWPQLEPALFKLIKLLTLVGCCLGTCAISTGTVVIPMMTCFLITASMKHLKILVQKQSNRCKQSVIWDLTTHNETLLAILNSKTRSIMEDFACETLTMDWPKLIDILTRNWDRIKQLGRGNSISSDSDSIAIGFDSQASSQQANSELAQGLSSKLGEISAGISMLQDGGLDLSLILDATSGKLNSSKASGLLFLYKNLVKSLSELRYVILEYEKRFGNFHQIISIISCLIVSLWVTSAFTEVRRGQSSSGGQTDSSTSLVSDSVGNKTELEHQANATTTTLSTNQEDEYKQRKVAYTIRIVCCTLAFVLSNVYIFIKCDCLSDRLVKIRSQLFKMNIDLACSFISIQKKYNRDVLRELAMKRAGPIKPTIRIQSVTPDSGVPSYNSDRSSHRDSSHGKLFKRFGRFSKTVYEVNHWKRGVTREQFENYVNQCSELDQIWSLYDQVGRISSKVNFKFSSDTYYSKRCVLLVFGRSISLALFFIQIIDMYST